MNLASDVSARCSGWLEHLAKMSEANKFHLKLRRREDLPLYHLQIQLRNVLTISYFVLQALGDDVVKSLHGLTIKIGNPKSGG